MTAAPPSIAEASAPAAPPARARARSEAATRRALTSLLLTIGLLLAPAAFAEEPEPPASAAEVAALERALSSHADAMARAMEADAARATERVVDRALADGFAALGARQDAMLAARTCPACRSNRTPYEPPTYVVTVYADPTAAGPDSAIAAVEPPPAAPAR